MTTETDRELLELAAKAVGLIIVDEDDALTLYVINQYDKKNGDECGEQWAPLDDDGDAMRLAVKLNLDIRYESYDAGVAVIVGGAWDDAPEAVHEIFERDGPRATRRAISRAAAEIGRETL